MTGSNPDGPLMRQLRRLLLGTSDAQSSRQPETLGAESQSGDVAIFIGGLRELPTSLLGIALDASERRRLNGLGGSVSGSGLDNLRATIRQHVSSLTDTPEAARRTNREIIDDVLEEACLTPTARLDVLEVAGEALGDVFVALALEQASSTDQPPAQSDTVAASRQTTLAFSTSRPRETLARHRRLLRLHEHDRDLARIYVLYTFAGRSYDEIAMLLNMDKRSVIEAEQIATVEVCLSEP